MPLTRSGNRDEGPWASPSGRDILGIGRRRRVLLKHPAEVIEGLEREIDDELEVATRRPEEDVEPIIPERLRHPGIVTKAILKTDSRTGRFKCDLQGERSEASDDELRARGEVCLTDARRYRHFIGLEMLKRGAKTAGVKHLRQWISDLRQAEALGQLPLEHLIKE